MRLIYLTTNAAFAVAFGDSLIDIDGRRFFSSRADAVCALKEKGLSVSRSGAISAEGPNPAEVRS